MTSSLFPACPVLVVDDESSALDSVEMALCAHGIDNVVRCQDSRKVMAMLDEQEAEVVLLDLSMPHLRGEELLPQIVAEHPHLPVVMVTGIAEVERVVQCMRQGAFDYLVKPVDDARLATTVRRAVEWRELCRENKRLRDGMLAEHLRHSEAFAEIITNNATMHKIFRYVEAIAPSDASVLVTGETGVGKELIARVIHRLSGRKGEFVAVNVSGLDEPMFSDTLFGHRKGAFTGAGETRGGVIERAADGTLLLDEIGDLSPASQVKLLRLLQEREYYPLGSDEPFLSTVRIVSSTCRDLGQRVASGEYRGDLFYRLQGHHVHVPPLRERLDTDLPALVEHFLTVAAEQLEKSKPTPPPELLPLLRGYSFPGNVRELESMIHDAVSQHERGVLSLKSLKEVATGRPARTDGMTSAGPPEPDALTFPLRLPTIAEATHSLVNEALARANGNQSLAAQMLGITPQALSQRLKRAAGDGEQGP